MADQCSTELPGSIVESFTLAIELVGAQVKNSPELVAKVLNNPTIQAKIKESLEKRLGELQKKALEGRPIDSAQALEQIKSVFTVDTLDATKTLVKSELEKTAKYRQLKSSLDSLSCKFKARPIGFFYDEAEGVLLIMTVGVMVAGAVGMYVAATGDVDSITGLAGKIAEAPSITVLGKVDLGPTDIVLKPSQKQYDAGLYAKVTKWKAVEKAELKVVVQTKDEKVAAVPISVETKVKIVPNWFNTFGATYEPIQGKASFSLGIVGGDDSLAVQVKANVAAEDKKFSYGGSAGVEWKPVASLPINITGGVGVMRNQQEVLSPLSNIPTKTQQTDVSVNLGLTVRFK
ncbi:MAG TPA: hypothetical protein VL096_13935 [Pirellulaceae bacterium]|nr:hypothetical protein [Pirellulaceae bacterium]